MAAMRGERQDSPGSCVGGTLESSALEPVPGVGAAGSGDVGAGNRMGGAAGSWPPLGQLDARCWRVVLTVVVQSGSGLTTERWWPWCWRIMLANNFSRGTFDGAFFMKDHVAWAQVTRAAEKFHQWLLRNDSSTVWWQLMKFEIGIEWAYKLKQTCESL